MTQHEVGDGSAYHPSVLAGLGFAIPVEMPHVVDLPLKHEEVASPPLEAAQPLVDVQQVVPMEVVQVRL